MYNSVYSSEMSPSWSNPDYELISELGRGGMGVVYKARRLSDQRILAVKVLPPQFADPEFLIRFQRETQVLAQLDHPHIVKVYDYGEQSSPFFAMEVMEGKDLKELFEDRLRLTGQPFAVEEAIDLIAPIAEALAHCHSQNILHRDIKLANIFIKDGGHPVLVDFGLSKQSNENSHGSYEKTLSKTGEILGTVAYMSPEQLSPNGDYGAMGPATDVWSLGTALFLLLTCHFPYPAVSAIQLYMKIAESPVPILSEIRPDVPKWLTHLLFQMLSKHSSERPTMEVVARTLRGLDEEYSSAVLQSQIQPEQSGHYFSLSSLALFITVPASLILAFFLWQGQEKLQLNELDPVPAYISDKKLILKGQLNQGPVTISVGDRKDVSKVDGRFELSIPLKEGANIIEIAFSNGRGKDLKRSYTIRRDTKAPVIQWALPGSDHSEACLTIDDCAFIKGNVIESQLDSVTANQTKLDVKDGQFVIPSAVWESSCERVLVLRAKDKAGNETERLIKVRPSILNDHELWRRASKEDQDRIIEGLIARLRAPFQYAGTTNYSCNDREYRIARFEHIKTGMKLHLLPGGDFYMGIPSVSNESAYLKRTMPQRPEDFKKIQGYLTKAIPQHRVSIKPFLIAPHELTEQQWSVGRIGKTKATPNKPMGRLNRPLVLEWLEEFPSLRLLSEAEWEYAARAGTRTRYFWGDEFEGRYAWYFFNGGRRIHLVTEHAEDTNAFGLSDMLGNIWELVADDFRGNYLIPSTQKPYFHPQNPGQGTSLFRGGGANNPIFSVSLSTRLGFETRLQQYDYGTRLAASFDKVFAPKK